MANACAGFCILFLMFFFRVGTIVICAIIYVYVHLNHILFRVIFWTSQIYRCLLFLRITPLPIRKTANTFLSLFLRSPRLQIYENLGMTPYDVLYDALAIHWVAGKSGGVVVSYCHVFFSCSCRPPVLPEKWHAFFEMRNKARYVHTQAEATTATAISEKKMPFILQRKGINRRLPGIFCLGRNCPAPFLLGCCSACVLSHAWCALLLLFIYFSPET